MMSMSMLESPLEALAFNYVSFGIFTVVNNMWTWIAVATAAISFWRIKTTTYSVKPDHQPRNTSGSQPVHEISPADTCVEPPSSSPAPAQAQAKASPSVSDVEEVDVVTKGSKFTLCYYEEKRESDGELTVVKEWGEDNGDEYKEWWERVMRMRMGDVGWYRYQDLTVINGNVVRLWDECRIRERCRAVCVW